MNLEGSVIGNRYKIQEKIGNGGMATVYKALDQILNRYVAVKVLREEFTTDEEFIKRFNAEAQSAARLTHPNIVSVYDVGQEYNLYCYGINSRKNIKTNNRRRWSFIMEMGCKYCNTNCISSRNGS